MKLQVRADMRRDRRSVTQGGRKGVHVCALRPMREPVRHQGAMMDVSGVVLGVAALAISAWAAWQTRGTAKTQTSVQQRLLALESVRERDRLLGATSAKLRAQTSKSRNDRRLAVRNGGHAEARAVLVYVDDKRLSEHDIILLSADEEVTVLGPGAEVRNRVAISMGSPMRYDVRLGWVGDSRQPGRWRSQLRT